MPITIKDIAKKSGFSVTTVSRALTGYDDVSARTRAHIMQIADDLGYQANHVARQLQSQRTYSIGFVMPPAKQPTEDNFFSILLKGVTSEAARHGYDVLVSTCEHGDREIETYHRIAGGKRVDGIVTARLYRDDPRISYLDKIKFPYIVNGRRTPNQTSHFPYIDVDSQLGIAMLTEHLLEQGYDRIGIILPPEDAAFTPFRLAGYREALEGAGHDFDENLCVFGDLTYDGGMAATRQLLGDHPDVNAIVGCNDWMALGALAVAKEHGHIVGQNFGVGGYDDIPAAFHSDPSLTTIRQPIFDIGKQLTEALIELIENKAPTVEIPQRLIEPTLVVRDSSGKSP